MTQERGSKRFDVFDGGEGKQKLMSILRSEADAFIALAVDAGEQDWYEPSACEGWDVRDVAAHLLDGSQTYVGRYVMA
jgi:hypothetical protein